ncbi:PRA1 family protein H [Euphorbia lathyris]|uniref:PRA1 family protein H n=1 Tax=Euphorbia lathyris TaxID=212925 RepID=UPI003313E279
MAFSTNPLSLTVPDPAFESWLRDSGYLEILDQRSTSVASSTSVNTSKASSSSTITSIAGCFFVSLFSHILILLSLFTLNPLAKLTIDDFSAQTPSWTRSFFGDSSSYSFPSGTDQARLRVHENIKRYARNYSSLSILFFACSLYQMPLALIGLISSLALWDIFKFCSDRWGWDGYAVIQQVLIRSAQCVTAIILVYLNVQMALFCALGVSYAVTILHAAFRKLTPAKQKQPSKQR